MAHRIEIKIRGYHLDFYGHVNNARYMEFLEEGRWALFEDHVDLKDWQQRGLSFLVVNINISYRQAASLGNVLAVDSFVTRLGKRSGVIRQEVTAEDTQTLVADADVTFVIADAHSGRALPLTGDILRQFERLRRA